MASFVEKHSPESVKRLMGCFPAQFYKHVEASSSPVLVKYVKTELPKLVADMQTATPFTFYSNDEAFSNFNPDYPFQDDAGNQFGYGEQWLMLGKALLFKDSDATSAIMQVDNPTKIKAIGRKVQNYDDQEWKKHRFNWMVFGLLQKARSNKDFQELLLADNGSIANLNLSLTRIGS
eukprot:Platyproteum_vivax@DN2266_c0_g1_i2.p1